MDLSDRDKPEVEKRNEEEPMNYHSPGMSTDWRYTGGSFVNSLSMGLVPNRNPITVCGDVVDPPCSSSSMVDSFGPTMWDHPINSALGFTEVNVPNGSSSSDPLSMLKSGLFLPNMSGMLPHSLSQLPTDSAFIERAARFSSFNREHFSDILNPLGVHQPTNPYIRAGIMMPVRQSQKGETNIAETLEDDSLPTERFYGESKQDALGSRNGSEEAGFSGGGRGGGVGEEDGNPSPAKGLGPKKRKRGNKAEPEQAIEVQQQSGEAGKNDTEFQHRGGRNSTPTRNKSNGKNGKQNSQASDPTKEDYIHVRARRGQATNSHSLAERVRREKISERMKFLQDLVPGCSKVTGKAVMLDEIINYVQSLQRQVEFLSMKLATVDPRLDANIERLLAKDQMFSAIAGPSSGLGFSPEIPVVYPQLHPTQPSMLQPSLHATANSSDVLRRTITSQMMNAGGGYKEPAPQVPNAWEDELHNVVHMGFNASTPLDNQETNCPVPSDQTKPES